ncbi:DUF317 domain-containing protein [Streptomyces sp. NPDC058653]|uniref:DUF317 domain-containing protein n=1 Tax=Streptomyces sp. NPDC058653 TaxID=3346576 RepID=UPI003655B292
MSTPSVDARVRLDTHPAHPSAVTATLTGTQAHIAHVGLEAAGWHVAATNMLVLARIDHEEPYWAEKAARQLRADGITVEITPELREAIDEEWTWANYPMPWCSRAEIREVSDAAQKIHDDIRHGRLLIHAHAQDAHTTVAVGTYLDTGKSVYLHGENHLRQIANSFDSPARALTAFEDMHADTMRPGPARMTDTERDTADARTSPGTPTTAPEPPSTGADTATANTPTDMIETLLTSLDTDTAWTERTSAPLTERTLNTVTGPLTEFGWTQTINGHHINWPAPNGATGLRLDVAAAVGATTAHSEPAWTLWGGKSAEQPAWTIEFSPHTPAAVLQDLTYNLALTHSARTAHPQKVPGHGHKGARSTAPATPTPPVPGRAARSR